MDEEQVCFPIGEYMLCNYVVVGGRKIESKTGGYLRFPLVRKQKTSPEEDEVSVARVKD